jgi:hypothetical protein
MLALLFGTGFLVLIATRSQWGWDPTPGIDDVGLAGAQHAEKVEQARQERIAEQARRVQYTLCMRLQIVAELLADRLDLFAAAAEFEELNHLQPSAEKLLIQMYPHRSPGERACRHVLLWVAAESGHMPAGRELHARLKAQLESHLRSHDGVVLLPARSPSAESPLGFRDIRTDPPDATPGPGTDHPTLRPPR